MPKISQIDELPCRAKVRILQKITLMIWLLTIYPLCSLSLAIKACFKGLCKQLNVPLPRTNYLKRALAMVV